MPFRLNYRIFGFAALTGLALAALIIGFPIVLWLSAQGPTVLPSVLIATTAVQVLFGLTAGYAIRYGLSHGLDPLQSAALFGLGCLSLSCWGLSFAGSALPGYMDLAGLLVVLGPALLLLGVCAELKYGARQKFPRRN